MAKIVFDIGTYDQDLYNNLKKFDSCRNTIAYRILFELPSQIGIDTYSELGRRLWNDTFKKLQACLLRLWSRIEKFQNS